MWVDRIRGLLAAPAGSGFRPVIVFVDYEHEQAHSKPWGERLLAARTWITYRLEDLSGQH